LYIDAGARSRTFDRNARGRNDKNPGLEETKERARADGDSVTIDNAYARWVNDTTGSVAAPTDTSTMNCWQAVLYTCYAAGLIPLTALRDLHNRAMDAANGKALAIAQNHYNRIVQGYLSAGSVVWDKVSPIPAGNVILFGGLAHVALSLGTTRRARIGGTNPEDRDLHEAMSLWRVDQGGTSMYDNRRVSVEELAVQCVNDHNRLFSSLAADDVNGWDGWLLALQQCEVRYTVPPWGR
jgi:alkylated DNA nucleotide flippase Atl1